MTISGCTQLACFSLLHFRYGARLRRYTPHVLSHDRVAIYQLWDITASWVMNIDFSSSQKQCTAARLQRNVDTHNTRNTQTLAPRPTSQDCNYAVYFASPALWRLHLLTGSWWISSPDSESEFQPASSCRRPPLVLPQREKTASDAYPHPCSGDEWESHLLSACIWKPDLSAGWQRAALHISPTPLWQHAPHFCRITSAFIWSTPHSLPVCFLLLSFTSCNTVSVQ